MRCTLLYSDFIIASFFAIIEDSLLINSKCWINYWTLWAVPALVGPELAVLALGHPKRIHSCWGFNILGQEAGSLADNYNSAAKLLYFSFSFNSDSDSDSTHRLYQS
jgi:hypothetical protein